MIQPQQRTIWIFLKKLQTELLHDPAVPLLDIYFKETIIQKDIHPNVHFSTVYKS